MPIVEVRIGQAGLNIEATDDEWRITAAGLTAEAIADERRIAFVGLMVDVSGAASPASPATSLFCQAI